MRRRFVKAARHRRIDAHEHGCDEAELRRLDLNLLLVFAAVMRDRGVSRAAARLGLGASAVSMALARLRGAVGHDLFVRTGPGVEPTPRAEALWSALGPALASVQRAVRGARGFDPAASELVVRFAAPDDLDFILLPELLARMERLAPRVRLVVRPSDVRTLMDRLDSGDADLELGATPRGGIERRHRARPLHRDGFLALFDPAMVGTAGPLDLETYLAVPHLLLSPAGHLDESIDDRLAELGRARTALAVLSQFGTIPFLLKRRRAVANMPATAAHHCAAAYGLALSPLPLASPEFEVSLVWHVRTDGDPAHAWFRDLVSELVAELRDGTLDDGPPRTALGPVQA